MSRTILVTGATGQQGRALISSLLSSPTDQSFHVLALTRNPSGQAAQSLLSSRPEVSSQWEFVKGDLDEPESVRNIFQSRKGKIWGVFAVLAYPGLGASADGEERQGIALADMAFESGVEHFVYSSAERGGEAFDDEWTLSRAAKVKIERHVKSLGEKGLKWTIIRPGFFMENFNGTIGKIAVGVFHVGIQPTTKMQLIAAEDIGHVAAAVFRNPVDNTNRAFTVVGDVLTIKEQDEAYERATGRRRPSIPGFLARIFLAVNGNTRELINEVERLHKDRSAIEGGFEGQLNETRSIYPRLMTFEQWAKAQSANASVRPPGWNKVSLLGLIMGKQ